jgi:hypothetical protein
MPTKKGASTSGARGVGAPSNKHAQKKMKSGNPTPTAKSSKRAGGGKSSKKGGK